MIECPCRIAWDKADSMAKPDGSTTLLGFVWDEYATTCHAIVPEYYAVVANENDGKPIVRRQALRLVLANMFVCHGLVGEARDKAFEALANFEEGRGRRRRVVTSRT